MLQTVKQKRDEGFTIIEVLIVLAIAGLIMVVVFLAVPALQRNSRNNALKTDANNILSAVGEIAGTNNGALPAATAAFAAPSASGDLAIGSQTVKVGSGITGARIIAGSTTAPTLTLGQLLIVTGAKCNGNALDTTGVSARSYVVFYPIETSGSTANQCVGS